MRKLLVLILIGMSLSVEGQIQTNRQTILGQVEVENNDQPEGISVFNLSSGQFAFTDKKGQFKIPVRVNDTLLLSSLQYQEFKIRITPAVIKKGYLKIALNTSTTPLEKVVVAPDLSGYIQVDVGRLETPNVAVPHINTAKVMAGYGYQLSDKYGSPDDNTAMDLGYMKHGLNFVNLYQLVFPSKEEREDEERRQEQISKQLQNVNNNEFFQSLGIEKDQISAFIYYLANHGLTGEKLQSSNDLELIQFIVEKSKSFKAKQTLTE